ncbi:hypothetical protein [Curtobacterium aetherium]|uniref:Uncharacterized protein n=1 Tax=Curtobacterium aetherium TaxID=2841594 RepID=A0ACD1E1F0_9MICO|nr:hypothetical protein [Curtobacterium sp. L6-1]QWS32748.1 hypothetical protein KM842_10730 [Curtobacterium sp. L6-1]
MTEPTAATKPWFRDRYTWKFLGGAALFLAGFVIAPILGVVSIFGCVFGLVADNYDMHADSHLRSISEVTTGTVIDIDVRHYSGAGKTGGHTECIPIVKGEANGSPHTWELTKYPACNDYYTVGERLQVMYDPTDVDHAGVRSDKILATYRHNLGVDVQIGLIGLGMSAVGATCWTWLLRREKRKKRGAQLRHS